MNKPLGKLTLKDYTSDQEVRWCPGCGDCAILKTVQKLMPELDVPRENLVFVSGIGCSSRRMSAKGVVARCGANA